jgi:hypothetical protein
MIRKRKKTERRQKKGNKNASPAPHEGDKTQRTEAEKREIPELIHKTSARKKAGPKPCPAA